MNPIEPFSYMADRLKEYKQSCLDQIPALEKEIEEIENIITEHFKNPSDKALEKLYYDYKKNPYGSSYMASQWQDKLKDKIGALRADALPTEEKYFNQFLYSDVNPYKCVKEFTPNKVGVVRMRTQLIGEPYSQDWKIDMPPYTEDDIIILRRHKDGKFYVPNTSSCPFICAAKPYKHYDWEF